jgi:hypothetical protein
MTPVTSTSGDRMIKEMRQHLMAEELVVAQPLFDLAEASIDHDRSSVVETDGFVRCRFTAQNDVHCPFEVHFGRDKHEGRFNFFIALGAEVANYEPITRPEELAADLRNFLMSRIVAKGETRGDVVLKEEYSADRMVLEQGAPLRFFFAGGSAGPFTRGAEHQREYAAWFEPEECS